MAVAVPLRCDFDAAQLRALAKRSRDPDQTRRLLALAAIYDGASRTEAAQIGCVTLQIVRDWVLRFNARGPEPEDHLRQVVVTIQPPPALLGGFGSPWRAPCDGGSSRTCSRSGSWSVSVSSARRGRSARQPR